MVSSLSLRVLQCKEQKLISQLMRLAFSKREGVPHPKDYRSPVAPSTDGSCAAQKTSFKYIQATEHHGPDFQEDRPHRLFSANRRHLRGGLEYTKGERRARGSRKFSANRCQRGG